MMLHPLLEQRADTPLADVRTLFIKDLLCDAAIGVHNSEKGGKQKIVVNVAVRISNPNQAVGDDFAKVLDYGFLREAVHKTVGGLHIQLVETVCEAIADLCLAAPTVQAVYVRVGKLEPFDDCEVGCEMIRHRTPVQVAAEALTAEMLTA